MSKNRIPGLSFPEDHGTLAEEGQTINKGDKITNP
jgi:hypothetical protein